MFGFRLSGEGLFCKGLRPSENRYIGLRSNLFSDGLYVYAYIADIKKQPTVVIPTQAGIQTSIFQKYLKIAVNPNLRIPAYAGMTVGGMTHYLNNRFYR